MVNKSANTPAQLEAGSAPGSTAELARRWRSGDLAAFEALVTRFCGALLSYVISMIHHLQDAEDIVQETLIRAHRSIHQLKDDNHVWLWLKRIAHNVTIDTLKRARHSEPVEDLDAIVHPTSTDAQHRRLVLREIVEAIEALPETYRETAIYHYLEEWPYSKIAETLGIEPATVRQRINRINRVLRESLGRNPS